MSNKILTLILLFLLFSSYRGAPREEVKQEVKIEGSTNIWLIELYKEREIYNAIGKLYSDTKSKYGYVPKSIEYMTVNASERITILKEKVKNFDPVAFEAGLAKLK